MTMDGDHCDCLFKSLGPVAGRFNTKPPGSHQFGQARALIFLVFNNQYFFVAHLLAFTATRHFAPLGTFPRYAACFIPGKVWSVQSPPAERGQNLEFQFETARIGTRLPTLAIPWSVRFRFKLR